MNIVIELTATNDIRQVFVNGKSGAFIVRTVYDHSGDVEYCYYDVIDMTTGKSAGSTNNLANTKWIVAGHIIQYALAI